MELGFGRDKGVIYLDFIKEVGRLALLGGVSWILTEGVLANLVGQFVVLDEAVKAQIIAFLTLILKSVDRWLHETKIAEQGITRF